MLPQAASTGIGSFVVDTAMLRIFPYWKQRANCLLTVANPNIAFQCAVSFTMGVGASYSQVENREKGGTHVCFPKFGVLEVGKLKDHVDKKSQTWQVFFPACGGSSMQSPLTFAPSETKSLQHVSIDGGAKHFLQFVQCQ